MCPSPADLQGFSQKPLKEIFLNLFSQRAHGTLKVQKGRVEWELVFRNGEVVGAYGNQIAEIVPPLAVKLGLIPVAKQEEFRTWIAQNPRHSPGDYLRTLGIGEEIIKRFLRQQLSRCAAHVLLLRDGNSRFVAGKGVGNSGDLSPSPLKIFLDAVILGLDYPSLPRGGTLMLSTPWERLAPELKEPPLREWFSPLLQGKALPLGDLLKGRDQTTQERILLTLKALLLLGVFRIQLSQAQPHPPPQPSPPPPPEDPQLKKAYEELSRKNYFEILGVTEAASQAEIKKAYFRLAKQYHPDRYFDPQRGRSHPTAEALFALIVNAYETLSDESRRQEYVESLKSGRTAREEAEMAERVLKSEMEFQKGMVFFRKKQWKEATQCFSEAFRLNPNEPEYQVYHYWAQFLSIASSGEIARRIALDLEQFLARIENPPPRGFYFLGRSWKILGDLPRARDCLQKAAQALPEDREIQQELRVVDQELKMKGLGPSSKIKKS